MRLAKKPPEDAARANWFMVLSANSTNGSFFSWITYPYDIRKIMAPAVLITPQLSVPLLADQLQ